MPNHLTTGLIERLRGAALGDGTGPGDGELLGHFVEGGDGAAFAALVRRHGPMVWATCRRLLPHHDAEDAFQATFLVLARKAASVAPGATVGNWLHGVAHRTALHARRTTARRRAREVPVGQMPDAEAGATPEDPWADVRPVLDEELGRLPAVYRAVIVLCDLEGRTRKAAARQLGVPDGTVGGRLARARALLAERLARRGVVLAGGALAGVLSAGPAAAASPSLMASTIKVASLLAAGRAAGVVSVNVAALTDGVVNAMFVSKIKSVLAAVLAVVALGGAAGLVCRTQAGEEPKPQKPAARDEKGGAGTGKNAKSDGERLQGKWKYVSSAEGDVEETFGKDDESHAAVKGESMRSRLLPKGGAGEFHVTYFRFRLDEKANPKTIDLVEGRADDLFDLAEFDKRFEDADARAEGIYEIDGDTLKVCVRKPRDGRPAAFDNKDGSNILHTFKRVP